MPNSLRGEISLTLGKHTLTLRPTFDALAKIESATSLSLIALARKLAAGEATLAQLQAIVIASAVEPLPADLRALLANTGSLALHEALLGFVIGAITGETHA